MSGDRDTAIVLRACVEASVAGARAAKLAGPKALATKDDPVLGHHAVVSAADYASQRAILAVLGRAVPKAPVDHVFTLPSV